MKNRFLATILGFALGTYACNNSIGEDCRENEIYELKLEHITLKSVDLERIVCYFDGMEHRATLISNTEVYSLYTAHGFTDNDGNKYPETETLKLLGECSDEIGK